MYSLNSGLPASPELPGIKISVMNYILLKIMTWKEHVSSALNLAMEYCIFNKVVIGTREGGKQF